MEKKNNKKTKKEEKPIDLMKVIEDKVEELEKEEPKLDIIEEEEFLEEEPVEFIKPKLEMIIEKPYSFDDEVKDFLIKMINSRRARMTSDEAKQLEGYYNRKLGLAENVNGCDICLIKMFRRLRNIYGIK